MPRFPRLVAVLMFLALVVPAHAEDAKPGDTITWQNNLPAAFAKAKRDQKILMICVNAKFVDGRKTEESAAKGLREVVYRDKRVVGKSREFVCAMLGHQGGSGEYGELRALGIDGNIVSPQHIFVHPDGKEILLRREYWSYGKGDPAVAALLDLMNRAQQKLSGAADAPEPPPVPDANGGVPMPEGAPAADARAAWIQKMLAQVADGNGEQRKAAIDGLVQNDKDGDCTTPLIALIPEHKKNADVLVALIRGLGRDGLVAAAQPIADQLKHREIEVRGNAAVSLEYIGHDDKKVVAALRKAADREKDLPVANHMYRALGRCGTKDAKVRSLLLKKAGGGKSEFATYGPGIALAYFVDDKKAARGVEGILKKMGVPGSRRGGGANTVKRGLMSWTLAAIGDPKSETFVREELLKRLENVQAFWVGGLRTFWDAVARKCGGADELMDGIQAGVGGFVRFARDGELSRYGAETRGLMDEYRIGRDTAKFKPVGDNLLGGGDG